MPVTDSLTLMVHLQAGHPHDKLLALAADLVRRMSAGVIGIVACQPMQMIYGDGSTYVGDVVEQDQANRATEMAQAEAEFRAAFAGHGGALHWEAFFTAAELSDTVARAARGADMILTGVTSGALMNASPPMSTGELIMQAGRPVLIVPEGVGALALDHAVIGWKDTRETRRAALDALPLLRLAGRVSVVEIAAEADLADARQRLQQVQRWLAGHGIKADLLARPASGDDSDGLDAVAREVGADLVVAGAYGHNRVREWALGGVTRNLLLHGTRCALLSH